MALNGAGTQSSPYELYTVDDLRQIYTHQGIGVHFKMMNDIMPYMESGFPLEGFQGIFDGAGYKLQYLYINKSSLVGAGLFKYLDNATVKNVALESFNIMGESRVGALAGESYNNVVIESVMTTGTTFIQTYAPNGNSERYSYAGGLIGIANTPVTYRNCAMRNMQVQGYSNVGGFEGWGYGSIFLNCYSAPLGLYGKQGGAGSFSAGNTWVADASTSYYVDLTANWNGGNYIPLEGLKNQSQLSHLDFVNSWGISPDFNEGYAVPKVFLPQTVPAIIEKREVEFHVNSLSVIAVSKLIKPLIRHLNNEFNVRPIDFGVQAHSELFIPFVKRLEVTHFINPISLSAYAKLIRIIRKQIDINYSIKSINSEFKITHIKKSIGEILHYMNEITLSNITVANLKPTQIEAMVGFIENGNDVSLIQYLLNNIYIKENTSNTSYVEKANSISHINNRSEVKIVAFTGDSVKLQVKFKTFSGEVISPTDVKLKIYESVNDSHRLIETIDLSIENQVTLGTYAYDYVIPEGTTTDLVYEFSGIYNGKMTLARGKIPTRFV